MSVICFASMKGGVGKTSLSINVSHAFAHRGCTTLLIDLDPSGHATRFFKEESNKRLFPPHAPLAAAFLARDRKPSGAADEGLGDTAFAIPVRRDLELLPGGADLRHLVPAQGAALFAKKFPPLLEELKSHFDHIVIDTPPDYNVLTRNAIACSDLVAAPVDTSEMGIHSVEELFHYARSIKRPTWALVRTMVNRRAETTQVMASSRLNANLALRSTRAGELSEEDGDEERLFLRLLKGTARKDGGEEPESAPPADSRLMYLLDSVICRTDYQNQLTFLKRTAFDGRKTQVLARQYLSVAGEIEDILSSLEEGAEPLRSEEITIDEPPLLRNAG